LDIQHRHGVEIDLCPQCRGVWLNRGELDTIIERASRFHEVNDDNDERLPQERGTYRRKSFWHDLFE